MDKSDCNCPWGRMSLTACRVADLAAHGRLRARRFGGPKSKSRDRLKISKSSQRIEYTAWRCRERQGEFLGILVGLGSFVPRMSFTLCVWCLRLPLCWSCRCRPGPQCWWFAVDDFFLRWSSYLQGWLQSSATEGSPNSESSWCRLRHISACRYARSKGWTQTLTSQIVVGVMVPFLEHDIEYHGLLNLVVSWRHSMIWAKPQTWRIRGCYFDDG